MIYRVLLENIHRSALVLRQRSGNDAILAAVGPYILRFSVYNQRGLRKGDSFAMHAKEVSVPH